MGFGITYEIPIRIYNDKDEDYNFAYEVQAGSLNSYVQAQNEQGEKIEPKNKDYNNDIFGFTTKRTIKSKEWTNIILKTRLLTGSGGEMRHMFKVENIEEED